MRWILPVVIALSAGATVVYATVQTDPPTPGRYVLGGTESDGLVLLDTATGRTWKYDREVRQAGKNPIWIPLQYRDRSAATPADSSEDTHGFRVKPGLYQPKRPSMR